MTNDCGIYQITNTITGDFYIGSSCNLRHRICCHHSDLIKNKHGNTHLLRAWNKYGEQSFVFETVLLCDVENKLYYEQVLIDGLKPVYNIATCATANMQGFHHTEDTKCKMSDAWKTRPQVSEETKRKISEALTGTHRPEETRRKISEANKGNTCALGHKHTEETKRKISEAKKGELNHRFGTHPSEETRAKLSKSITHYWAEKKAIEETTWTGMVVTKSWLSAC